MKLSGRWSTRFCVVEGGDAGALFVDGFYDAVVGGGTAVADALFAERVFGAGGGIAVDFVFGLVCGHEWSPGIAFGLDAEKRERATANALLVRMYRPLVRKG
jgi:hypothetical protein